MGNHEFKIRASAASQIVAQPQSKADKEAGKLGKTSENYVRDIFLLNKYGYREQVITDAMTKGNLCEAESRELISEVLGGGVRMRNINHYSNVYATGTPDIVLKDCLEDIKNSWNLKTFFNSEVQNAYYWQAQVYMWLTNIFKYRLIYTLNPTPFDMVEHEKYRMSFKFEGGDSNPDFKEFEKQIDHNNNLILSLQPKERIRVFEIEYCESDIEFLISQVVKCRNYYDNLKLA
jgi:hypothetical protein